MAHLITIPQHGSAFAPELSEYLAAIRRHVCVNCVERRAGGPPCEPLGKLCGVEQHLAELVDAIHAVRSESVVPYCEGSQRRICEHCSFRHSSVCPCPMDYLHVLIVQAVEAVDARHHRLAIGRQRLGRCRDRDSVSPDVGEICRLYEENTGSWTGCDWPTKVGTSALDLNGWTAEQARTRAATSMGSDQKSNWQAAADWLAKVEQVARDADDHAVQAVCAALVGDWLEALDHARLALAAPTSKSARPSGRRTSSYSA